MNLKRIILELPEDLLPRLDDAAFAARRTREELILLLLSSAAAEAPINGAKWIEIREAARRSGRSMGQINRKCRENYSKRGLAELRSPVKGGKPCWHIREDADFSFLPEHPGGPAEDCARGDRGQ